jgi:hypothetical protein
MAFTTPGTAVAGEVLTAAFWNEQVRDNSLALKHTSTLYASQVRTTIETGISATTFAAASELFTGGDATWTADGTSTYLVEFFVPFVVTASATHTTNFGLSDGGSNQLALMGQINNLAGIGMPVLFRYYYTPAAGSRSVNIRVWVTSNTSDLYGENAGSGFIPMYLRVTGAEIS